LNEVARRQPVLGGVHADRRQWPLGGEFKDEVAAAGQALPATFNFVWGHCGPSTSVRGSRDGAGSIIIIVIGSSARKDTGETGAMTPVIL
jgi:hypothetical protein